MASDPKDEVPDLTEVVNFSKFFEPTAERGAALSAVADLDFSMEKCLKATMIKDDNEAVNLILGEYGIAGGFGQRLRLTYALGLIHKVTYKEISIINRIRNEFAHRKDADSFQFPKIQGHASALWVIKTPFTLIDYLIYAERIRGKFSIYAKQKIVETIMSDKSYDYKKPNWGFVLEVTIFTKCFERAADSLLANPSINRPLF